MSSIFVFAYNFQLEKQLEAVDFDHLLVPEQVIKFDKSTTPIFFKICLVFISLRIILQLERQLEAVIDNADPDTRQWTTQHLEAANVPNPSIMALTPPTGDELDSKDVDVRGPDGFTPLMLASFRGMGLDSGVDDDSSGSGISGDSEESGERSPEVIRSLLMQGAAINAQTDRTGKPHNFPVGT